MESAADQDQVSQMRMVPSLARRGGSRHPAFSRRRKTDGSKGSALRGMVPSPTPKRDRGDPQAFRLRSARALMMMVAGEGLEPHGPCGPTDFLAICGFRRRHLAFVVWTIPS